MSRTVPDRIAIIVSTYNAAPFLTMTLEGYARQSDRAFSIYIADDGSGPEVAAVIEAFRARHDIAIRHLWHEDKGYRRALALNRAINVVEEPYIVLTDADCVPLPDMVATHKSIAEQGILIRGSRVLISEDKTAALGKAATLGKDTAWNPDQSLMRWLQWRMRGHINRLFPILMPAFTSAESEKLPGIRGCHFAFWTSDARQVNGFDSSYEGWGREDSDFAARLFHAGVKRKNLYGMPVLHLWHKEASRDRLGENNDILSRCLAEKRIRAIQGLDEL
ncbi:MAG: hypothetical protein COS82_09790 [Zetaproteobacteria bacterium CG06_land_8_20_14_3_00_59_53]|nr:MAG: hypothetical protein AUK36_01775 [Zetaproteobacteria bacterium CG2_30_59_37]PIO88762.1 MAG: hypothetical protein COX56_11595 [Zetaproteobacteria bacterium CG23_combo_of_CG06-09_8_20_14_all_59_86]PIQ65437.1 MAG: hypothetical protein COV97_03595 [Zetaproteobacteria bacterium CG11_big_fil_rev_8_21_14_0_20_59_439]PIU69689.1 MAG: hypothetical protein COS82_09790 [Zetaproteobacteria bacterium CG06_land_8_20_14_3_00_59_53]PIU96935.1 MAG: hypothetical protein COS62_05920 [Zetaproteobacteria bac